MIEAKGYKAFRGTMRINWDGKPHEEIYGDWIYTKDGPFGFWHNKELSYPASVCEVLEEGGYWEPDPYHLTKADRIRAMSDEELANFLTIESFACNRYKTCEKCPRYIANCCLPLDEWLQQPAEE